MLKKIINNTLGKFDLRISKIDVFEEYCLVSDKPRSRMLHTTLQMIVDNKIDGSFAEVGVFKGETAVIINKYAKNKKLYLFDTFEGFMAQDLSKEVLDKNKIDDFTDTSEQYVSEKLANTRGYGEVVIKKGYFPESAKGLENEHFAFVHLDADLKEPIQQGLIYFWPKLAEGGGDYSA